MGGLPSQSLSYCRHLVLYYFKGDFVPPNRFSLTTHQPLDIASTIEFKPSNLSDFKAFIFKRTVIPLLKQIRWTHSFIS